MCTSALDHIITDHQIIYVQYCSLYTVYHGFVSYRDLSVCFLCQGLLLFIAQENAVPIITLVSVTPEETIFLSPLSYTKKVFF